MFSACETTYQSDGITGGYSEMQLDENAWKVSFRGNGFTDEERATELALMRCAEICLETGYSHFIIVDSSLELKEIPWIGPSPKETTTGTARVVGNNVYYEEETTTREGNQFGFSDTKPKATNTIVCFKGKPMSSNFSYNAEFLLKSLKQKYGM